MMHNLRDMSFVERWQIFRRSNHQSLADHSYYVAVYSDWVAGVIGWQGDRTALMRYALLHDIEETITGDIPGPAKRVGWDKDAAAKGLAPALSRKFGWALPLLNVEDDIKSIVSVADSMDEVAYLGVEATMGNGNAREVLREATRRLGCKWAGLPATVAVVASSWDDEAVPFINAATASPSLLMDTPEVRFNVA